MADFDEFIGEIAEEQTTQSATSDLQTTSYAMGEPFETVAGSSVARARRVLQRVWDVTAHQWCYFVESTPNPSPEPAKTKPQHSGNVSGHEVLADFDPDLDAYASGEQLDQLRDELAGQGLTEQQITALVTQLVQSKAEVSLVTSLVTRVSALENAAGRWRLVVLAPSAPNTVHEVSAWDFVIARSGQIVVLPPEAEPGAMVAVAQLGNTSGNGVRVDSFESRASLDDSTADQSIYLDGHGACREYIFVERGWLNVRAHASDHLYPPGGA